MPKGYDYLSQQEVDAFVDLKYLDFYDFIPKEELQNFKSRIRRFALSNKKAPFSSYRTDEDIDRIKNLELFSDVNAFSSISTIEFMHNSYLSENASRVSISIRNLSVSFACVRYRILICDSFNKQLNSMCKTDYKPFVDVSREYNVPWYRPKKFGTAHYSGDYSRKKAVYEKITELKWNALSELRKHFRIFFFEKNLFPPTFETYSTNIRPSNSGLPSSFWGSICLERIFDYSVSKNACMGWPFGNSETEGMRIFSICGGKRHKEDTLPGLSEYHISDLYGNYLVAESLRRLASRDIKDCNRRISKAIRNARSSKLLRVRTYVEKELYYAYRFLSEFSGSTIDATDCGDLRSSLGNGDSQSEQMLIDAAPLIAETKTRIDSILSLLNNAAEYASSKQNMHLQWWMFVFTALAFIVAIIALNLDWKSIYNDIRDFINQLLSLIK